MRQIERRLARLESVTPAQPQDHTRPALVRMSTEDLESLRSLVVGLETDPAYSGTPAEIAAALRYQDAYRSLA